MRVRNKHTRLVVVVVDELSTSVGVNFCRMLSQRQENRAVLYWVRQLASQTDYWRKDAGYVHSTLLNTAQS